MKRLRIALLICILLLGLLSTAVLAEESGGKFVLVAEAGGKLVFAPHYISYTAGQTLGEALMASGHTFTGMEQGQITAIDDVTGNYTRSDQNGGYDLSVPASSVTHFCFSERSSSQSRPSEGLLRLMSAMADYLEKPEDVQKAAKAQYQTARQQFVGCGSQDAAVLARELNDAVAAYETTLSGTRHTITFTDGSKVYSTANRPGVTVTAENPYGKVWTDDNGDGKLELPVGNYSFCVRQDGLQVEGTIAVTAAATVSVSLPETLWLKQDAFRLSGSYGADTNEEHRFVDGEFAVEPWDNRNTQVTVTDLFHGAVYVYAEYDRTLLSQTPTLTAIYTMAGTDTAMEKSLAFESKTSGSYEVLAKGAAGSTVIYRLSAQIDGYTCSQDYTVTFRRLPTLTAIAVTDQSGTDQAPSQKFAGDVNEYTYKVLDTATSVTISAVPMVEDYAVTIDGRPMEDGVTIPITGETTVDVTVSSQGYSNTYVLTIQPGEGRTLSFLSDKSVTVEVVNSNGVVMPFTTHRETATQNRYRYTLVPGETYHYIATRDQSYHIADDFRLEEVANSTITVDFSQMDDWLSDLSLGTSSGRKYRDTIALNQTFGSGTHGYEAVLSDTEHNVYLWADTDEEGVEIQAIYTQLFSTDLYHGREYRLDVDAGSTTGVKLSRFLMDENPVENTLTIRLTREENGITYYQDYQVALKRSLTLQEISARCDGAAATLVRKNGKTGFAPAVTEYEVTVSMAARELLLNLTAYTENLCFGETAVGYRILVNGTDVTQSGSTCIELTGTMETQTVTITVENDKAPGGTTDYTLRILKSPPVVTAFDIAPAQALLSVYETMSGERLWPDADGTYSLCEGYSYRYTLTRYGYVGKSGTLEVTRDENSALIIRDGGETYAVTETETGGAVTVAWTLAQAQDNPAIDAAIPSPWPNFRGSSDNNALTDAPIPTAAEDGVLYWASKLGEGYDSDAVGSPILVDGDLITYAGDRIFRVDTVSGEILATGTMDHKSSFSITPPTYAEGMIFVALSNGCVQAFNADTLESLWIYHDPLGGQPNCPLTVKNGCLYTGFWNSETGDANFVCLTITDEDPTDSQEIKCNAWYYTSRGGYYWAGAYVSDEFVLVGTDDGTNACNSRTSSLLLLDAATGRLLDRRDNLNGDIRSTVVYDDATDAWYFTSKGGSFYSVEVVDLRLTNLWSVALDNHDPDSIPMSTCSPVIHNGRAYVGVSGTSQFGAYSGHNISVIDISAKAVVYDVETQGYPQTSGLLCTAYEADSGYVYIYFFDNMTPGKLRVLRDRDGQTAAEYLTVEGSASTAYALFTPTGDHAQYAICSPIVDEYGTVYFKNDSGCLMAFGSAVEKIEITKAPDKTAYVAGEKFDPTGMVVTATYANGTTRDVTAYVSYFAEGLTAQDGTFTIAFEHVLYHNQEDGTGMISGVAGKTPTATLTLTISGAVPGDVNGDGTIDQADVQTVLDYEAGLLDRDLSPAAADVGGDGVIDSSDAVLIARYLAGTLTQFPVETAE